MEPFEVGQLIECTSEFAARFTFPSGIDVLPIDIRIGDRFIISGNNNSSKQAFLVRNNGFGAEVYYNELKNFIMVP